MRQMARNLFGQDPEPPSLHDGPYRGTCPLDNRFPVENLLIGDNVTMLCRSHRTLLGSYTDALQGFFLDRMSAAIKESNAGGWPGLGPGRLLPQGLAGAAHADEEVRTLAVARR